MAQAVIGYSSRSPGPKKKETPYWDRLLPPTQTTTPTLPRGGVTRITSGDDTSLTVGTPPPPQLPQPVSDEERLKRAINQYYKDLNAASGVDAVSGAAPTVRGMAQRLVNTGYLPEGFMGLTRQTGVTTGGGDKGESLVRNVSGGGAVDTGGGKGGRGDILAPRIENAPSGQEVDTTGGDIIAKGTQDAIVTIDSSISEIRSILNQSLADPTMMAIAYKFIEGLSGALKGIQDELAGWYAKLGTGEDLGLRNAIQVLRQEIEYQKSQLAESLNAKNMLQSGIMAAAEARLRGGGLDQAQALVANRLSELQGVIIQSINSLAQTRMQSLSSIYQQGLQSMTSLASAREGTRAQALSTLGQLTSARAGTIQGGAVEQVAAAQKSQELQQQRERDQQNALLARAQADYYRSLSQPAGYTSTEAGNLILDTINYIRNNQFYQETFDATMADLRVIDPEFASRYEAFVRQFLNGRALPRRSGAGSIPATSLVSGNNYTPSLYYGSPRPGYGYTYNYNAE